MSARISGWARDPHDTDAPENDDTCEGCGVETEDIWEMDLTRDEANELERKPEPGKNWLCLSCLSRVESTRSEAEEEEKA